MGMTAFLILNTNYLSLTLEGLEPDFDYAWHLRQSEPACESC